MVHGINENITWIQNSHNLFYEYACLNEGRRLLECKVCICTHTPVRMGGTRAILCMIVICSHGWGLTCLGTTYIWEIAMPQRCMYQKNTPV